MPWLSESWRAWHVLHWRCLSGWRPWRPRRILLPKVPRQRLCLLRHKSELSNSRKKENLTLWLTNLRGSFSWSKDIAQCESIHHRTTSQATFWKEQGKILRFRCNKSCKYYLFFAIDGSDLTSCFSTRAYCMRICKYSCDGSRKLSYAVLWYLKDMSLALVQ